MNHLYEFEHLSSKSSFNSALGHFQTVSDLIGTLGDFTNIADTLNELLQEKEITQNQLLPAVNAIIYDKLNYQFKSHNMTCTITDFEPLVEEVKKWNAVDIVMIYYHPDLGPMLINPKNKIHFESIHTFKSNELITVFAGNFTSDTEKSLADKAITSIIKFLEGKKLISSKELLSGKFKNAVKKKTIERKVVKKQVKPKVKTSGRENTVIVTKQEEIASKPKRITPYYSVPVTNELFHNGNVEAWKKIIQSYNAKYPSLEVYIYYDGERIHDIHSLFKWGKVKHGSTIMFAVAGDNIKDVAKLQRYLKQGASIMFESFLKFPVNKILNLF
ncbi:MAG: hypothetical protein J7L71_01910 [Spirochaetaceae bacterium]|nr:hypothetical protein [Spirochaetaceae bacterium]